VLPSASSFSIDHFVGDVERARKLAQRRRACIEVGGCVRRGVSRDLLLLPPRWVLPSASKFFIDRFVKDVERARKLAQRRRACIEVGGCVRRRSLEIPSAAAALL